MHEVTSICASTYTGQGKIQESLSRVEPQTNTSTNANRHVLFTSARAFHAHKSGRCAHRIDVCLIGRLLYAPRARTGWAKNSCLSANRQYVELSKPSLPNLMCRRPRLSCHHVCKSPSRGAEPVFPITLMPPFFVLVFGRRQATMALLVSNATVRLSCNTSTDVTHPVTALSHAGSANLGKCGCFPKQI